MADDTLRDQISRLEERIEDLAGTIEGCRKYILFAKIAMAAGALWWLAFVFGFVWFDAAAMIASLAAIIGGIVAYGSNARTLQDAQAEMAEAEAKRAELISGIDLQLVETDSPPLSAVVPWQPRRLH
jgi:hypothetical protein